MNIPQAIVSDEIKALKGEGFADNKIYLIPEQNGVYRRAVRKGPLQQSKVYALIPGSPIDGQETLRVCEFVRWSPPGFDILKKTT